MSSIISREEIQSRVKANLSDSGPRVEASLNETFINREYSKPLKALGKRVALKKHEKVHERFVGDDDSKIFIPTTTTIGVNLNKASILSVGKEAAKYGLKKDDEVLYDHFAVHQDFHPHVVIDVENIICVFHGDDYMPIGKYIEVELTDIILDKIPENIILLEDSKPKYVYKVLKLGTGYDDFKFPVKVGDLIIPKGESANDITVTIKEKKTLFILADDILAFYND